MFFFLKGLEKPKKERLIKKLSAVNKAASSSFEDFEMGCNNNNNRLSDRENEIPSQSHSSMSNATAKKIKLPKKVCLILFSFIFHFSFFVFFFVFVIYLIFIIFFSLCSSQLFDDCNGVDHSSVPRKLRSGMLFVNHKWNYYYYYYLLFLF